MTPPDSSASNPVSASDPTGDSYHHDRRDEVLAEVLVGLEQRQKTLPCKYLYDERGSDLFDAICKTEDYYVTRADLDATRRHADEIAAEIGAGCRLVELGSGSSLKIQLLLSSLAKPAAYVPVEISPAALRKSSDEVRAKFPELEVLPLCADYTQPVELPTASRPVAHTVVYFPGSTIGNFHRPEAAAFLARMGALCGDTGSVLIGVDRKKDPEVLHRAYNDSEGVSAAFNLNILRHLNRITGSDFDLESFVHDARYVEDEGRVEMHLRSTKAQGVRLGDRSIHLEEGETIRTEVSNKYSIEGFAELAGQAGLDVHHVWMDSKELFTLQMLRVRSKVS